PRSRMSPMKKRTFSCPPYAERSSLCFSSSRLKIRTAFGRLSRMRGRNALPNEPVPPVSRIVVSSQIRGGSAVMEQIAPSKPPHAHTPPPTAQPHAPRPVLGGSGLAEPPCAAADDGDERRARAGPVAPAHLRQHGHQRRVDGARDRNRVLPHALPRAPPRHVCL